MQKNSSSQTISYKFVSQEELRKLLGLKVVALVQLYSYDTTRREFGRIAHADDDAKKSIGLAFRADWTDSIVKIERVYERNIFELLREGLRIEDINNKDDVKIINQLASAGEAIILMSKDAELQEKIDAEIPFTFKVKVEAVRLNEFETVIEIFNEAPNASHKSELRLTKDVTLTWLT